MLVPVQQQFDLKTNIRNYRKSFWSFWVRE